MATTAPAAAPSSAALVQYKEDMGAIIAQFIADETPLAGAVAAAAWNHYAPGFARVFMPATSITATVTKVLGDAGAAVKAQKLVLDVPAGLLTDVMQQLDSIRPGLFKAIEDEVDRGVVAASKAMGILPGKA